MSDALAGFIGVLVGVSISAGVQWQIARANRQHELATAALEKRLAAHQEAYALWRKIVGTTHRKDEIGDVVRKAEEWWEANCLYLDPVSREDFRTCMLTATGHSDLVEAHRGTGEAASVKESWALIMKPGQSLVQGVQLPSLGEAENPSDAKSNA